MSAAIELLVESAETDLEHARSFLVEALDAARSLGRQLNPDTCPHEIARLRRVEDAANQALQHL